jgi:hypothetical protein
VDAKAVQTPFVDGRTVSLRFPADRAPERVVFVLKELSPENWINNGSQFTAQIKPPDAGKLLEKVLSLEGEVGGRLRGVCACAHVRIYVCVCVCVCARVRVVYMRGKG